MRGLPLLGPFSGLSRYKNAECELPDINGERYQYFAAGIRPKFLLIDFDVRPALVYASGSLGKLRTNTNLQSMWEEALAKAVKRVSEFFTFPAAGLKPRAVVSGECDDGTVSCTLVLPHPQVHQLHVGGIQLAKRILQQKWTATGPYAMDAPRRTSPGFDPYSESLAPPLDRLQVRTREYYFTSKPTYVYMVAESFFATTDTGLTFALRQWNALELLMRPRYA